MLNEHLNWIRELQRLRWVLFFSGFASRAFGMHVISRMGCRRLFFGSLGYDVRYQWDLVFHGIGGNGTTVNGNNLNICLSIAFDEERGLRSVVQAPHFERLLFESIGMLL